MSNEIIIQCPHPGCTDKVKLTKKGDRISAVHIASAPSSNKDDDDIDLLSMFGDGDDN